MKFILLSAISMLFVTQSLSGQVDFDETIQASFKEYREAVLEVNFEALVKMGHPDIIKKGGGPTYFLEEISNEFNMYSASGMMIKDLIMKQASKVVRTDDDLQAMVPYVRSFEVGDKITSENNFFLVTSQDNGKSWNFTDMKKYDAQSIKIFIPNYHERLSIYLNSVSH